MKMRLKYVTYYSNKEPVTKSSTVPDWIVVTKIPSQESESFFQHNHDNVFECINFACVFSLKNGTEG